MNLSSPPVRVVRKIVRVQLGEEAQHRRRDRPRAAVAARPTVAAVNRDLHGDGHRSPSLDFNPSLSDGGEDFGRARRVVGERRRDKLTERGRDPLSGR